MEAGLLAWRGWVEILQMPLSEACCWPNSPAELKDRGLAYISASELQGALTTLPAAVLDWQIQGLGDMRRDEGGGEVTRTGGD